MKITRVITPSLLVAVTVISSNIVAAQERLPFIGTKYFNLIDKSGSEESITLEKDGTTTLRFYGIVSQGVTWKGKFSNPLILFSDGDGLLFRENTVQKITRDGKLREECKSERSICQSDLRDIPVTQELRLPFIGTKYFNFMGGSGTWESITLEKDGNATLRFYGIVSQEVTWKGKFTNPLFPFPNEGGLLFERDRVYTATRTSKGEIIKCEGTLCESNLSSRWDKGLLGAYAPSETLPQGKDPRQVEADELLKVGITHLRRTSQGQLALSYFQQALNLYRAVKDREGEKIVLDNLGRTYKRWGDNAKAINCFQQLIALARQTKNHKHEQIALYNLGQTYITLVAGLGKGEKGLSSSELSRVYTTKAMDYLRRALVTSRMLGDWQGEASSLSSVGEIYLLLGDDIKSLGYFQQALGRVIN